MTMQSVNPNDELEEAWGEYVEGRRLELERGPWSLREVAGLPGKSGYEPTGYYLVQRAVESPHPMTWHSKKFENRDAALDDRAWRYFIALPVASWAASLRIPGVSDYAFNLHNLPDSFGGCDSRGSVLECENSHKCIESAVQQVHEVYRRRRAVGMMLDHQS